jgi:signal transduction histidine kinase/ActR/RegA family two-component response regulator
MDNAAHARPASSGSLAAAAFVFRRSRTPVTPSEDHEKTREQLLADLYAVRVELAALRRIGGGRQSPAGDGPEEVSRAVRQYATLLHRLTHLAESIGTARNHLTVFRDLRDFAVVSVPCIGIFISLYDEARDHRTAVYAWGDGEEVDVSSLPPMPVSSSGPNSQAVRTGRVVITNDYWQTKQRGAGQLGVLVGPDNGLRPQSSLVVPMQTMGRIVGTIEVQSYDNHAYREEHVTAMRMAANLAAVSLENMRLLEFETQARAAAEESNRLKDEFLATLSHELRTPLTAILGWSRMLVSRALDEGARQTAVETIERNARAQQQIVEDILDVSRIIKGQLRLEPEPVDVCAVVESAIETVRPAAGAKRLRLEKEFGEELSPVPGDSRRLQQVVWNLLSNAVKFTPAGGEVSVRVAQSDGHVRVTVADTGLGIRRDFLPYVFDRFRQGDQSTTRAHGGLGLGLSIVRHLVELHGGTVRAESQGEGLGARFTLELPHLPDESGAAAQTGADEEKGAETSDAETTRRDGVLEGLKVLAVDDEEDALELVRMVLERGGAEVAVASSAGGAVAALAGEWWPDVLLFDIGMPNEDGYQLLGRVRELERERGLAATPAIAFTAYAGETDRERARAAGFHLHLPKPVDPSQLTSAVADAARALRAK